MRSTQRPAGQQPAGTMLDRLRMVADRVPDRPAVRDGLVSLSYRQLAAGAQALAERLRALGVPAGATVAVDLPPTAARVLAVVGAVAAGAGYVPLDPDTPTLRRWHLLAEAQAAAVLTASPEDPAAVQIRPGVVEPAESAAETRREAPGEVLVAGPAPPAPAGLAYVIFTSGTTGLPKGVAVSHANLAHLLDWARPALRLTPGPAAAGHPTALARATPTGAQLRVAQLAGFGFDAAVLEVWSALTSGATLCIADAETRLTPHLLRDWLLAEEVSVCVVPTPLAEELLDLDWPPDPALRTMVVGGDRLHRYPPASLPFGVLNAYGPTETTVVATAGLLSTADAAEGGLPHIGRPIGRTTASVLDERGRPVPDGVVGELYLGGPSVALGYLGHPQSTAERFTVDPDGPPGAHRYRSGDLVRRRPDGRFDFCGRADDQLKVQGVRIEPAEVELAFTDHAVVRKAACRSWPSPAGDRRLVVYVELAPGAQASGRELREFAGRRLPAAVLPGEVVVLPRLPRSANGKIDRGALPAPRWASLSPT